MKLISFEKLYNTEFVISEPMAKAQYWYQRGSEYNALGRPKVSHTLLWLKNCSAVITDRQAEVLEARKNQLVYMPKGSEYRVEFMGTSPEREDTVVIHFQLTDMQGEDLCPAPAPTVCIKSVDMEFASLINAMADEFKNNIVCIPELKAAIYKLFSAICRSRRQKSTRDRYAVIREGIRLLEQNSDTKISDIAKECGVSECYFRRVFREYSGESPMDFRQHYRIEKAKRLLLQGEGLGIAEIADELHFSDIYHFSKTFKKHTGMSPNKYIKLNSQ